MPCPGIHREEGGAGSQGGFSLAVICLPAMPCRAMPKGTGMGQVI